MTDTLLRREFRAMGTEIAFVCSPAAGAERRLERAERWLQAYETRFSRFIPYSELTRLNRSAGRPVRASPLLFEFVRTCLDLAASSRGVFDPTLLAEIEAAGYDRTFDTIATPAVRRPLARGGSFRDVRLDAAARTITLPVGIGIDSGGLGKGWAADRIAAILGSPCLVDCGGDIAAAGRPPDVEYWYVGVQDPFHPQEDLALLAVRDRGIATSSTLKRRWLTGDGYAHHLIDARTGSPAESGAVQASVVAPTATLADYHAKVALLKGVDAGAAYLDAEPDVEGIMVGENGHCLTSSGFRQYLWRPRD